MGGEMVQIVEHPNYVVSQDRISATFGTDKPAVQLGKVTYQIVHTVPGRVRFRIPKISKDLEYTQALHGLASLDEKILSVRTKRAAASVVISYIPGLLTEEEMFSHLVKLIQLASNPAVMIGREGLLSDRQEDKSEVSWSALKLPALATFLSLMAGPLGLSISPILVGGAIIMASLPVAKRACESVLAERRLNVDFLDFAAIAIVTAQSHYLTSCSMIVLIQLGETIRERTARSSQSQTLDLLSSLSKFVWVERNGEKQQIAIEQVQPEDTVIVYPGEQIPVDGHILKGKAIIDQQKLTGESMPVVRSQGQEVYASTIVREGQLYILAERLAEDTRAGRTLKLLKEVPVHDTRVENYAAKIADRMVLPTILLGGFVFALTRSAARAASVLTIDLATGIRVSVPTTVMAALYAAARKGILIRSGKALEQLALVDAFVFDKTGTLTQGNVAIVSIETAEPSISEMEVLQLAASVEQRITHPVAEAIVNCANYHELTLLPRGEWQYQVGLGIKAQIDNQEVLVGSERFLLREGVKLNKLSKNCPDLQQDNYPQIFVARNGKALGVIQYADPLREESQQIVKTLREDIGAEIHILTGDNQQRANLVAEQLNIPLSQTHAEAFPEDKAAIVQALHDSGKIVAFVGDGLNDSAALAYADVSVSFRDGSDAARETADIVLMTNDLRGLVEAIAIARHAQKIISQNTKIVAIPNLSGLALAATVGINPMTATLINNGSSVIAGANGLRPALRSSVGEGRDAGKQRSREAEE
jgi:Cu2+-exporting ATPase